MNGSGDFCPKGAEILVWSISGFADEAGSSADVQIEALRASGLKFVDIRSVDGVNIVDLPLEHARVVKEKLETSGITVQMFGSPIGKIDIDDDFEIDLRRLRHLAELAPILGCNSVRIFSYFNRHNRPHSEWQEHALGRLIALRRDAAELGLVLYHENERHIFGDLPQDVDLIGKFVRDGISFKTIFDFDNYTQSGVSAWEAWQLVEKNVDAIHLKDSRSGQHVPVGQGDGYVARILADALSSRWEGPISIEPHLTHSGAVASTGPSGSESQAYRNMNQFDLFVLACDRAMDLLTSLGAPLA